MFFDAEGESSCETSVSINRGEYFSKNISDSFYDDLAQDLFSRTKLTNVKFLNYQYFSRREPFRDFLAKASDNPTSENDLKTLGVFGSLGTSKSWKYISSKCFEKNADEMKATYKFGGLGSTSNVNTISTSFCHEDGLVLDPHMFLGLGCRFVNFCTRVEADNFKKYFSSLFVKHQVGATAQGRGVATSELVPDLGDYTDSNPDINWDEPLDPQLYELFKLTEEEIKIVEENK